jgi:REP element-mobilizing transposase RayT
MSFWRTYYHLVWATKKRSALITPELERELYPYLISKTHALGLATYAVNGDEDHIHWVGSIPPKLSVSQSVQTIKGASSYFVTNALHWPEAFKWQRGFGVFTLGESQLERAISYVENQKEHHRANTTNRWLERITEDEDAPTRPALDPRAIQPFYGRIREPNVEYIVENRFP